MSVTKITVVRGSNVAGLAGLAQKDKDITPSDKEMASDDNKDNKDKEAKQAERDTRVADLEDQLRHV